MKWHGEGFSDIGCVRKSNQDTFLVENNLGLWIIADGMGTPAGGEIASTMAVKSIQTYFEQHLHKYIKNAPISDIGLILIDSIIHANKTIQEYTTINPKLVGMGTTVILVYIPQVQSNYAFIAHAGDSRAYLIRNQNITPLTRDHTLLEESIREGLLHKCTPSSHAYGHQLTKAVGLQSSIKPELSVIKLQPIDEILLCSDGLNKMLTDDQIISTIRHDNTKTQNQAMRLVQLTNHMGGVDNTTLIHIKHIEN